MPTPSSGPKGKPEAEVQDAGKPSESEREKQDAALDEALAGTFPASDPVSTLDDMAPEAPEKAKP